MLWESSPVFGRILTLNLQLPGKTQSMYGNAAESFTKLVQTAKIDHDVDHETDPWVLVGRQPQG